MDCARQEKKRAQPKLAKVVSDDINIRLQCYLHHIIVINVSFFTQLIYNLWQIIHTHDHY